MSAINTQFLTLPPSILAHYSLRLNSTSDKVGLWIASAPERVLYNLLDWSCLIFNEICEGLCPRAQLYSVLESWRADCAGYEYTWYLHGFVIEITWVGETYFPVTTDVWQLSLWSAHYFRGCAIINMLSPYRDIKWLPGGFLSPSSTIAEPWKY